MVGACVKVGVGGCVWELSECVGECSWFEDNTIGWDTHTTHTHSYTHTYTGTSVNMHRVSSVAVEIH